MTFGIFPIQQGIYGPKAATLLIIQPLALTILIIAFNQTPSNIMRQNKQPPINNKLKGSVKLIQTKMFPDYSDFLIFGLGSFSDQNTNPKSGQYGQVTRTKSWVSSSQSGLVFFADICNFTCMPVT